MEADVERHALVKEERLLTELSKNGDAAADARLIQVYAKLQEIEADKAEAKYLLREIFMILFVLTKSYTLGHLPFLPV